MSETLREANPNEFEAVRNFYWDIIEFIGDSNESAGWKKGIYPSDSYISSSIESHEMYVLEKDKQLAACVIINSKYNEGYEGVKWTFECNDDELYVVHALGIAPQFQHQGIAKAVVKQIIEIARKAHRKTIRLDVLGRNKIAEKLYLDSSFRFVESKTMFYEDTGWTEYRMFEYIIQETALQTIDQALEKLQQSKFRSSFHLSETNIAFIKARGMTTIRKHAQDFVRVRLAPANPVNDGKQTPMHGHPVFKAMHACACCCRGCLEKWYRVPKGRELTENEQERIVNLLMAWIERQMDTAL